MDLSHRQFHRVDLLSISGRVDAATVPQLAATIKGLFDQGRYRLVLDLADLNHISSAGLRLLIDARQQARDWKLTDLEGGDVRLAQVPPKIRAVFDLTGLSTLFASFDDVTAAVGSF